MERTFLEELIYNYNKNLVDGDLSKLDRLSFDYDMFICLDVLFTKDFETIVNYLVLNQLPYCIASGLTFNGKLLYNFIKYKDGKFIKSENLYGQNVIDQHVEKINKLLAHEY